MARTESKMIPLGTNAPAFELPDAVSGETVTLQSLRSEKATVIMFICNHCPFVKHVQSELVNLAKDYQPKGVSFIAISSNDTVQYPADSPEKMNEEAERAGYPFVYLFDETQNVARDYDATCTPDFFIFDGGLKLAYRGQLDDSRPNSGIPLTGGDIRKALDAILSGTPVDQTQKPSMGCNIKWRS